MSLRLTGPPLRWRRRGRVFHLTKELTCADGSGTFVITVNAATVFGSPTDQGGWSVVSGTGDYEGLNGGGPLEGPPCSGPPS